MCCTSTFDAKLNQVLPRLNSVHRQKLAMVALHYKDTPPTARVQHLQLNSIMENFVVLELSAKVFFAKFWGQPGVYFATPTHT